MESKFSALPPVDDALIKWLDKTYPERVIQPAEDETLDSFTITCIRAAGIRSVIDNLKSINKRLNS